jgi:hypothetical protein
MGRDESGTLATLKAIRQEVVDPAIGTHGGRIVKTTGDGLLLEFPSVVNAVRCAIEVQAAMAAKTADVPEDHRIGFRIGINQGDIIVEGDDIFGDGVNVAARLQEVATPGGFAYQLECMKTYAIGSSLSSTTVACKHSRTLRRRFRSSVGSLARARQSRRSHQRTCRYPISLRSRSSLSQT